MYAFAPTLPVASSRFTGASLSPVSAPAPRAAPAKITMQDMSRSVPFLLKPKRLDGLPGAFEFDPLLISDYINVRYLQASEIKHGRICMLASLGMIVQEMFTFGGSYFPKMLPVDAHEYYIQTGGMSQILMFIALFEGFSFYALKQTVEGKSAPGDFGFDPLGLGKDPTTFRKYQVNEIMNGRLAMIAVGGLIHQEWVTKTGAIDQLLHFKPL